MSCHEHEEYFRMLPATTRVYGIVSRLPTCGSDASSGCTSSIGYIIGQAYENINGDYEHSGTVLRGL
jgi:hypothetical protein